MTARQTRFLPFSRAVDCGILQKARRAAPKEQQAEGPKGLAVEEDAGTFWMRFTDFCEEFGTVEVSEYRAFDGMSSDVQQPFNLFSGPGYVSSLCHLKPTSQDL